MALGSNALHGHRRTNADKRRCVEIALREFPGLSSRAIAQTCGVSIDTVCRIRPEQVSESDTSTRTGQDGKQYPAFRVPRAAPDLPRNVEPRSFVAADSHAAAGPDTMPRRRR